MITSISCNVETPVVLSVERDYTFLCDFLHWIRYNLHVVLDQSFEVTSSRSDTDEFLLAIQISLFKFLLYKEYHLPSTSEWKFGYQRFC